MPNDYAHGAREHSEKKRARTAPAGWPWLVTGLAIGLFVAFLVYLKDYRPGAPTATPAKKERAAHQAPAKPERQRPEEKPELHFDFYTILPEMEIAVPEPEAAGKPAAAPVRIDKPGRYVLQTGSFRKYEEADRLKASLALLGVEATIQTVTINNQDTWHRVRIGPYIDLDQLNRVRTRLREHDIKAILLKLKG